MYKFFILITIFIFISCTKKETEKTEKKWNKYYYATLTDSINMHYKDVSFSNKGAYFYKKSSNINLIDTLTLNSNFSIHFWFNLMGENGKKAQNIFEIKDSNSNFNVKIWMAARRIVGSVGKQNLWAENYKNTFSKKYYNLGRLEVGKYYFLSFNFSQNNMKIFVNGEKYTTFNNINFKNTIFNKIILGNTNNDKLTGYIRNISIFTKNLSLDNILILSEENFSEIFPYNDKFDLSKFKLR